MEWKIFLRYNFFYLAIFKDVIYDVKKEINKNKVLSNPTLSTFQKWENHLNSHTNHESIVLRILMSPIHLNHIDVPGGSNNQQVRSYSFAMLYLSFY